MELLTVTIIVATIITSRYNGYSKRNSHSLDHSPSTVSFDHGIAPHCLNNSYINKINIHTNFSQSLSAVLISQGCALLLRIQYLSAVLPRVCTHSHTHYTTVVCYLECALTHTLTIYSTVLPGACEGC